MPTVSVNGEPLYYQHHRQDPVRRPPLVLVHGAGGNLMHWPGLLRRLRGYEVFALDLPGHGRSGGIGRTSVADYAEVVCGFTSTLELPPAVLAGHSMGGAIAQECALRYPQRLRGIVLAGTGAKLRVAPQVLQGMVSDFYATTELVTEWAHGPETSVRMLREYARRLRSVPAAIIQGDYAACDAFDRRADVAQIKLPALILCGTADRMTPPKFSQWLADQLSDSTLTWVPGAGHMVMLERPAEAARAVELFLTALPDVPD